MYFDGDVAVELGVARAVDFAHPTRTDGRNDLEMPEATARQQLHDASDDNKPRPSQSRAALQEHRPGVRSPSTASSSRRDDETDSDPRTSKKTAEIDIP